MTAFAVFKLVHVSCVIVSIGLFLIRVQHRFTSGFVPSRFVYRVFPHINDSLLLLSAIGMLWVLSLNPFKTGWLTAKIVALIFYILFGALALRGGRSTRQRIVYLIAAIVCFIYIVVVAMTRRPAPFL